MPIYDDHSSPQRQATGDGRDVLRGRTSSPVSYNPYYTGGLRTAVSATRAPTVDRQEIIRRIKSRDDRSRPSSPEIERQTRSAPKEGMKTIDNQGHQEDTSSDNFNIGMQIERPKSALHRGDFRERETSPSAFETFATSESAQTELLSTSPPAPWHPSFPTSTFRQAWEERRLSRLQPTTPTHTEPQRTTSSITGRHFVYHAPTSPLVQSSRPDTPPPHARRSSKSPDKQIRRHTFSPQALARFASDPVVTRRSPPSLRKESMYPYQAHQPRRSLHAVNATSGSSSRSAFSSRRPSASEAHSPLQHAPLVGSYEESILRGRMSTTPSKPLNFIAQIGVLGRGDCKPSLRCPPHVTVLFPAVFYSYNANFRQSTSDQPSPYVGLVDLEHDLPSYDDAVDRRRQRLGERLRTAISDEGSRANSQSREDGSSGVDAQARRLRKTKKKAQHRSNSPKAPPGGAYRLPQQGQLQIVIKNPNKTAVKLFLVPYDLSDMLSGQKTFIRQRSYSAGPIIDMPMSSRRNFGTDRPEASLTNSEDPDDRPVLRYLVHLHICCTGKGRYWLYKSIRVVFANRVPDGKEKLRNEIQLPEPRYSTYKAGRDSLTAASPPNSPSVAAARRSNNVDDTKACTQRPIACSLPANNFDPHNIATFRFPFRAPLLPTLESRPSSSHANDSMDIDSDQTRSETGPLSPTSSISIADGGSSQWSLDEPITFERTDGGSTMGESLLSRELKRLDM